MSGAQLNDAVPNHAFKLKGSLATLTFLEVYDAKPERFTKYLQKKITEAPNFFKNAPIVLDIAHVQPSQTDAVDFSLLNKILRDHGLIPVGVSGAEENLQEQAIKSGLAIIAGEKRNEKTEVSKKPQAKPVNKIITRPIRSGQQVYADEGDLIVIGSVSNGAELLAKGNIHVYGTLRGRALAGINGDKTARIFCHTLDAQMLSIAGLYQLCEEFSETRGNIQVYVDGEQLAIEPY